ncbi:MAG TPA: ABC transporter substrate-binding protein [Anaerolineae bacterium]
MKPKRAPLVILAVALSLVLSACTSPSPTPTATIQPSNQPTIQPANQPTIQPANQPTGQPSTPAPAKLPTPNLPTATLPGTPEAQSGHYENPELGISFDYPRTWVAQPGEDETILVQLIDYDHGAVVIVFYSPMPAEGSLEDVAKQVRDAVATGVSDVKHLNDEALTLDDERAAWLSEFSGELNDGSAVQALVVSTVHGSRLFTFLAYGQSDGLESARPDIDRMIAGLRLEASSVYGIPRDQALFLWGGESTNPRDYDPAIGGADDLIFSGLVTFNPQLEIVPDLAASWDISPDGTVYTFHLQPGARFHDGRPVTTDDVIYSWERAADPKTDSDTVLTYLGDIVGVAEKHAGKADRITGLKKIDDHTLEVTIDAPKPYFLMKLAYGTASVVDRANVESGPEWYRTPNGTGPYRLIRWDSFKLRLYERNANWYLNPPAIRYIVMPLYGGVPIRMYETGDIDIAGVSFFDVDRMRDPAEPLHDELREGVGMCTSYITFDATQPPFDDPKVRQAFALAVDRQRYIDVALRGIDLPARGLYPPGLPGFNVDLKGLDYDPELARQRLAESSYGSAEELPPIVFTSGGYGSAVDLDVAALIDMWQKNLGVTIQVENLDPNKYSDELHDGRHGQLFSYGWCADYPDPENFADALFHSGAQQNLGHYSNPELDTLLEAARVEHAVDKRIQMYQQAEQLIVDGAAAIFLDHSLFFVLVKPHIQGYALSPISSVPIERYLSIDGSKLDR